MSPDFYREDRPHLKDLCNLLQDVYEGKILDEDGEPYRKLIIQMPPQHGKTRTLINFCMWILGKNVSEKIIAASYSDTNALDFAKYTRDGIQAVPNNPEEIVYHDIFPETRIKKGDASNQRWALEGKPFSYISAGIGGTLTGKGGSVLLVDDPVKSVEEALNEDALKKIWRWYTGTFKSRVAADEGLPLEIIVMTPWAKEDLSGKVRTGRQEKEWLVYSQPVIDISYEQVMAELDLPKEKKTGKMLCPPLYGRKALEGKITLPDSLEETDKANYWMMRLDIAGRLYPEFRTYTELPKDEEGNLLFEKIGNYTDTADMGDDFLCSICYGVYNDLAYITDVYYTKDGMHITEPETAAMFIRNDLREADIESNNGGLGFKRSVERILREQEYTRIAIRWFHQSQNKRSRILTNSSLVMSKVLMPVDWRYRWPKFYEALTNYMKEGKKQHDDAPDAITGVVEKAFRGKFRVTVVNT